MLQISFVGEEKVINLQTLECPECVAEIPFMGELLKGEILTCPDCGAELEVTAASPIQLSLAPQVEEDWGE
jgi:alpha-aminoadipate/glutamate carrier protein LysW